MYKRILVPLEHTPYDESILTHVRKLARHCGASLVLIHVADGWAARNVRQLHLRESEEMREDRDYLEEVAASLEADGIEAECVLAAGNPGAEIAEAAAREGCDLIAMAASPTRSGTSHACRCCSLGANDERRARDRRCQRRRAGAIVRHRREREAGRERAQSDSRAHRSC